MEPTFGFSNSIIKKEEKSEEKMITLNYGRFYPKEREKEVYIDHDFNSSILKEEELVKTNLVATDPQDGVITIPEIKFDLKKWHPNQEVMNPKQNSYQNWDYGWNNRNYNPFGYSPNYNNLNMRLDLNMFSEGYHNMENAVNQAKMTPRDILERGNNMVDFSNPDSVAKAQSSPFGYGAVDNPNVTYDPYNYNPKANYSSWYNPNYMNNQGWYGNGYGLYGYNGYYDSRQSARPIDQDISYGFAVGKVNVINTSHKEKVENIKKSNPLKPEVKVQVVIKEENTDNKVEEESKKKDETTTLPDMIIPPEHPLKWTGVDEKEIGKLASEISVYNKAIAYVAYNLPLLSNITREMYNFYKEVIQERLDEYRKDEKEHPNLDYRIPYRYRRLPDLMELPNGMKTHNMIKIEFVPEKVYDEDGNRVYSYDRGREPNEKEWKLFYSRALEELKIKVNAKKVQWIEDYNKKGIDYEKYKNSVGVSRFYDRNNPIAIRCHELRMQEWQNNQTRWFYRMAINDQMTDIEFDKWWSGQTMQTEKNKQNNNPVYQRKLQIFNNINQMHSYYRGYVPDAKTQYDTFLQQRANAIYDLTDGCFDNAKDLNDIFCGFGYMENKYHRMNLDRQNQEAMNKVNNSYDYQKSLIRFGNEPNPLFNSNFRPGAIFGNADPKYGFPSGYVDLTHTDGYQQRKEEFNNYCKNSQGNTLPLRPVYL